MPLMTDQVATLAGALGRNMNLAALLMLADQLGFNLSNAATTGTVEERAMKFVSGMNSTRPPQDRALLQALCHVNNAEVRKLAAELLQPTFYPPPPRDPLGAILLGRKPFVDREPLRTKLEEFEHPTPFTTHVLVVRGEPGCGKSYSWEFIYHLAVASNVKPVLLQLRNTFFTPKQLLQNVAMLLHLDQSDLSPLADNPQLDHTGPLLNWFQGQLNTLQDRYWLVIDDFNDPGVTKPVRDTGMAMAYWVEKTKPNLWLALLGYNDPVVDQDLIFGIAQDDAEFPDEANVAEHFMQMNPDLVKRARAKRIAALVFQKYPASNRATVTNWLQYVSAIDVGLRKGQLP